MKIFLIILFLLFPLTGCFSQSAPANVSSPESPMKGSDPQAWDFGQIKKDKIVKHDFSVKNDSARTLTINGVTTSCGCTASEAKKKILAPGESTQISVEFNSKGYKGEVTQFVYVDTDDTENPVLKFTIKAFVQ